MSRWTLETPLVAQHVEEQIANAFPNAVRMGVFLPEDVFTVGFPKSGNTWMQHVVTALVYGVSDHALPGHLIHELVPDVHYKTFYQRHMDRCYFKSHFLPQPEYRRVIHIVRDGRDALVSYWHYQKALAGNQMDFFKLMEQPIGRFGTWSEHYRAWEENPFEAEIIMLRYEDLVNDPVGEFSRLCAFLGVERSDEELQRVARATSFKQLKRGEESYGIGQGAVKYRGEFFRRGKIGSYKEELPADVVSYFNRLHADLLRELDYEL